MTVATGVARPERRVLPFEPFERALHLRQRSIASLGIKTARLVSHAKHQGGFTRTGADLAACALGCHVTEIWSDWWDL